MTFSCSRMEHLSATLATSTASVRHNPFISFPGQLGSLCHLTLGGDALLQTASQDSLLGFNAISIQVSSHTRLGSRKPCSGLAKCVGKPTNAATVCHYLLARSLTAPVVSSLYIFSLISDLIVSNSRDEWTEMESYGFVFAALRLVLCLGFESGTWAYHYQHPAK